MWNAMKTKSLAAAVVVTSLLHGSLLWKMNDVATEAASGTSQTSANSRLAGSTESSSEIRYVTLEPVLIVGRYKPFLPDQIGTQADILSLTSQGQCITGRANPVTANKQKNGALDYC